MTPVRWRATAVIAVLALLSLTGCQTRAGTAAFVGSSRITDDQVRQLAQQGLGVKAVSTTVAGNVGGYRQLILGRLLKHVVIAGAARKLGVSVRDGQIDQAVSSAAPNAAGRTQLDATLAADPYRLPPSELRPVFRDIISLSEIGKRLRPDATISNAEALKFYDDNGGPASGQSFAQLKPQVLQAIQSQRAEQYVVQYLRTNKVTINPRYGRFDPAKLFDRNQAVPIVAARDDLVRDSASTRG